MVYFRDCPGFSQDAHNYFLNLNINLSFEVDFIGRAIPVKVFFNGVKRPDIIGILIKVLEPSDALGLATGDWGINRDAGPHKQLGCLFECWIQGWHIGYGYFPTKMVEVSIRDHEFDRISEGWLECEFLIPALAGFCQEGSKEVDILILERIQVYRIPEVLNQESFDIRLAGDHNWLVGLRHYFFRNHIDKVLWGFERFTFPVPESLFQRCNPSHRVCHQYWHSPV